MHISPRRYSLDEVRNRMMTAWDGVNTLWASGQEKIYRLIEPEGHGRPRFLTPEDIDIDPFYYEAW